jgi:hypothetical protein
VKQEKNYFININFSMWKILDKRKGGKGVRSHFILDMGAKNDQIDLKNF